MEVYLVYLSLGPTLTCGYDDWTESQILKISNILYFIIS